MQNQTKKNKPVARPLRRAIEYSDIVTMLNTRCKKSHCPILYSRMVVSSVLMFLLGIRVSEAYSIQYETIVSLLNNHCALLYRSKTNDYHKYWTTPTGIKIMDHATFKESVAIVFQDNPLLGGATLLKSYTKTFNRYLKVYLSSDTHSPITSHSFRISRITSLISSGMSISNVAMFIGHKNIATTFRYYRFTTSPDILKQVLSADIHRMPYANI
jgi:integrase